MSDRDKNAVLIYLSGNNGSGKSTLGRALAPRLGFSHLPEEGADQSYLCDLFSQPKRWSFEAQAHFLTFKAGLVRHSVAASAKVLVDRSPYEDAEIFARYFRQARRLDVRAYRTYQQLYQVLVQDLPEPNLVIY
jgi:deoxyadenosine/deoxycytidine kinase